MLVRELDGIIYIKILCFLFMNLLTVFEFKISYCLEAVFPLTGVLNECVSSVSYRHGGSYVDGGRLFESANICCR